MKRVLLSLFTLVTLLAFAFAYAGQRDQWQTGKPWTGTKGVTLTIAELQALAVALPPRPRIQPREVDVNRHPRPNPNSPAIPRWASKELPAAAATPIKVGTSWNGVDANVSGDFPPDSMGAIGPTQFLACENGSIRLYSRTGVLQGIDESTDSFFSPVLPAGNQTSDPRVRFDPLSDRWFVVIIDFDQNSDPNDILIAVSSGATLTAASSFTFFSFQFDQVGGATNQDTGDFFDQPSLGIDNNALYIGGNVFNGSTFSNTTAFVVRKSSLLGSGPIVVTAFRGLTPSSGSGFFEPIGVENYDSSATSGLFVGIDNTLSGQIDFREVTDPGGTPSISPNIALTVPATASPNQITVLGGATVDANDDRITHAELKMNKLTGKKTLWTCHNVLLNSQGVGSDSGDRVGTRWYEIDVSGSQPVLVQSGTVFDPAPTNFKNYWMGAIGMSGRGTVGFGSTSAGAAEHLEVSVAGRASGDPLGILSPPVIAQSSSFDYSFGGRWGDYSYVSVDPTDDMTLWTVQEFAGGADDWQVKILQLLGAPPATAQTISPNVLVEGTAQTVTVTGDTSSGKGYFDPGPGFAKHIRALFSGTGVTASTVTVVDPGHLQLNLTVAANASTGAHNLTVVNPDGQAATTSSLLTVVPTAGVYLSGISVAPTSIPGGGSPATGTVTLNQTAAATTTISLASSSTALTVPLTVSVPANSLSATFSVTTSAVTALTNVTITGTLNGFSQSCVVHVQPPGVSALTLSSTSMYSGGSVTGQVAISLAAGSNGVWVTLTSSNSSIISLQTGAFVPAGSTLSNSFPIRSTTAVTANTAVTITASLHGISAAKSLLIMPAALSALVVSKTTLTGGDTISLHALLTGIAPSAGAVVKLSSSRTDLIALPSSTTVAATTTVGPTISETCSGPPTSTSVTLTATYNGISKTAVLQINPPVLQSLQLSPTTLAGGNASFGNAVLSGNMGGGSVTISLSSSNPTIANPGTSTTVTPGFNVGGVTVRTINVATNTNVTITAKLGTISKSVVLTITPPTLDAVNLPTSIAGGDVANGTVTINGAAPASSLAISMSYSTLVSGPASVTVPSGQSFANLSVNTSAVASSTNATVSATLGGVTKSAQLTLTPATLLSFTAAKTTVGGGQSVAASVNLDGVAASATTVSLNSSNTSIATVPSSVTVAAGASSAPVTITTFAVTSAQSVTLTATLGSTSRTLTLNVVVVALSGIAISPDSVVYGGTAQGTVTLSGKSPTGGITVTLNSLNSAATVPASIFIAAGQTSGTFNVTTTAPQGTTTFPISASFNGQTVSTNFTIQVPFVTVLLFNPSSVKGGTSSTATIGINVAAPTGGLVINLSSGNTNAATVPSTVTIPAGQTQTTFTVSTKSVSASTQVTITATLPGSTTNSNITVSQ